MKRRPLLFIFTFLALACAAARAADDHVIDDFDRTSPEAFSFKDDKGTVFNASGGYQDDKKGKHGGIRYNIVSGGWGGWGIGLAGFDASPYRYLAFDLKGEKGGELFEVGLRDKAGKETKISIKQYVDVSTQWRQVLVPLADFKGVNLSSLDNVSFGFNDASGAGRIYFANLKFTGTAGPSAADGATPATLVSKSLVDGFERANPSDAYKSFQSDDASLALTSSRFVHEGDYAMEMDYTFSTVKLMGSWVSAVRNFREPLDWTGAQEVKIWVKGDGSENAFRLRFTEESGEAWEFLDKQVLRSTKYVLLSIPVEKFRLQAATRKDGRLDLSRISSFQLDILSPINQLSSDANVTSGQVIVDQMYLVGEKLLAAQSAPAGTVQQLRVALPSNGNVDFTMVAYTEYLNTPEQLNQVNHYAKLVANGKVGNFSARAEFGSNSQEFGQASSFVGLSTQTVVNNFPTVVMPSLQVMMNNVSPYLSNVTLGNVFVDYSPTVFTADFGFKGATAEGDYGPLNYHAFVIKHVLNAFTAGTRLRAVYPGLKLTLYGVNSEENAQIPNAATQNGASLVPDDASVIIVRNVTRDTVYNVDAESRLWQDRITFKGLYGVDYYHQSATVDRSNLLDPIFGAPLAQSFDPVGRMYKGRVELDGWPWDGLSAAYGYRNTGTEYKPRFRQIPSFFDDTDSDQHGHTVQVAQHVGGWVLSNEYDDMHRDSNSSYFRHEYSWGVARYGYKGVDVVFNQMYRRETYVFTSDRSSFSVDRNEKVITTDLYVRVQLSTRMAVWIKPQEQRIWHPSDNTTQVFDSLRFRLDFYVTSNALFFVEHNSSRYGTPDQEPVGFPFDDNFTRVAFQLTF